MRSPFRDEHEAALARVEQLERENAELLARLEAARRATVRTPRPSTVRPAVLAFFSIALGMLAAILTVRSAHVRTPSAAAVGAGAAVTATPEVRWHSITTSGRTMHAAAAVAGTIYLAGEDGVILRFGDPESEGDDLVPRRLMLSGIGGERGSVYAVGEHGAILAERAGRGWEVQGTGIDSDLLAVTASGETAWAVGRGGVILRRARDAWVPERSGTTRDLHAVTRTPQATYAVGASGTILVRRDALTGWVEEPSGVSADLLGIYYQERALYAVGKGGTILRRAPDGWTRESSGVLRDLYGVGGDGASVFAVGEAGTILRSSGAGVWRREEAHTTSDLFCVAGSGNLVYAAGSGGALLRRSF